MHISWVKLGDVGCRPAYTAAMGTGPTQTRGESGRVYGCADRLGMSEPSAARFVSMESVIPMAGASGASSAPGEFCSCARLSLVFHALCSSSGTMPMNCTARLLPPPPPSIHACASALSSCA